MALGKFRIARFILVVLLLVVCLAWGQMRVQGVGPGEVYSQYQDPNGGYYNASENGNDWDEFVWDDFTLFSSQSITGVRWFGTYDPLRMSTHQPILYFIVAIYGSTPAGNQPDVTAPLVEYQVNGNAGETIVGTFGGLLMYDYYFPLPSAFQAKALTKYWIYLEAYQAGVPDWCIARGTGGNNSHFHEIYHGYNVQSGDAAFILLGPGVVPARIILPMVIK